VDKAMEEAKITAVEEEAMVVVTAVGDMGVMADMDKEEEVEITIPAVVVEEVDMARAEVDVVVEEEEAAVVDTILTGSKEFLQQLNYGALVLTVGSSIHVSSRASALYSLIRIMC